MDTKAHTAQTAHNTQYTTHTHTYTSTCLVGCAHRHTRIACKQADLEHEKHAWPVGHAPQILLVQGPAIHVNTTSRNSPGYNNMIQTRQDLHSQAHIERIFNTMALLPGCQPGCPAPCGQSIIAMSSALSVGHTARTQLHPTSHPRATGNPGTLLPRMLSARSNTLTEI